MVDTDIVDIVFVGIEIRLIERFSRDPRDMAHRDRRTSLD